MHFDLVFHIITRFGNNEDVTNREKCFKHPLEKQVNLLRKVGNLFQGYVHDNNTSKETVDKMKQYTEMGVIA